MRIFGLLALPLTLIPLSQSSAAMDARMLKGLMRIDPNTRLEQVCDIEAMRHIARGGAFKPDRAKSDVTASPQHIGNTVLAQGGAFRSKGRWYALSFACIATPDHLKVLSFTYKIGALIPSERWATLGLWQ